MIAKRLIMSLLAVGTIALLVSAATFAVFTAQTGNYENEFYAGTVSLEGPTGGMFVLTPMAPGDVGNGAVSVKYTGSLEAWVWMDVSTTDNDGDPSEAGTLFTCNPGRFEVAVDGALLNTAPQTISHVLLGHFNPGAVITVPMAYKLDILADNACQDKSAEVSVTFHAVQYRNNVDAAGLPIYW